MRTRIRAVYCLLLVYVILFTGCGNSSEKPVLKSPPHYDLRNPVIVRLPPSLDEVSGISYYAKDTSVFAIEDEDGIFSKVYMNGPVKTQTWRFDKKHDYEDIVRIDSTFYVLISNGDLAVLKFVNDSIKQEKFNFQGGSKKVNEFEIIYYDEQLKKIVMMCKECQDDKNSEVTSYGFDPFKNTYTDPLFKLDVKSVEEKMNIKKLTLKPSAAAIHPLTNELYIISAVNNLLLITERNGTLKEGYKIDPKVFNQPEGIAFTPSGSMLISNEIGENDNARILIFKYIK